MIRVDAGLRQGHRQDPHDLDFLALDPGYSERELEDALVARIPLPGFVIGHLVQQAP